MKKEMKGTSDKTIRSAKGVGDYEGFVGYQELMHKDQTRSMCNANRQKCYNGKGGRNNSY